MKTITVKIENNVLHLAEVETQSGTVFISKVRAFPLPDELLHDEYAKKPEKLASFIASSLKKGRLLPKTLTLLFDGQIIRFREYYHQNISKKEQYKRAVLEAESTGADVKTSIIESQLYGDKENQNGMLVSAAYVMPNEFLIELIDALKGYGLRCNFVGSTLSAYSDVASSLVSALAAKNIYKNKNIAALDVEEKALRLVLFSNGKCIRKSEYALADEFSDEDVLLAHAWDMIKRALKLSGNLDGASSMDLDCVLLSGSGVGKKGFDVRLGEFLHVPCKPFGDYYEDLQTSIDLNDEMSGRRTLYPRVLSMAGPSRKKNNKNNFLYGGIFVKRRSRRLNIVCLVALALVAACIAIVPALNEYMEGRVVANEKMVGRQEYVEAREISADLDKLREQVATYEADEEYFNVEHEDYAALLFQVSRTLFRDAQIEKFTFLEGSEEFVISFTTEDINSFLDAKDEMNSGQSKLWVIDPVQMDMLPDGGWACSATVSWAEKNGSSDVNGEEQNADENKGEGFNLDVETDMGRTQETESESNTSSVTNPENEEATR